jgi:hypothetical protein
LIVIIHRVHAKVSNDKEVSLWHDIPLFPTVESEKNHICNMVNEVILTTTTLTSYNTNNTNNTRFLDLRERNLR